MVSLPLASVDGSAVELNLIISRNFLQPWLHFHCLHWCRTHPTPPLQHSMSGVSRNIPSNMESNTVNYLNRAAIVATHLTTCAQPILGTPAVTPGLTVYHNVSQDIDIDEFSSAMISEAIRGVCLVRIGHTWGSAIIVSRDGCMGITTHYTVYI